MMTEISEERSNNSKIIAAIAFFVTLLLAGAGWFFYNEATSTKVPAALTVVESESSDACKIFRDAKLECAEEFATDEKIARFSFLSQSVAPDSKVKKGTLVTLTYSKGPASFTLTELRNETVDSARKLLDKYGIKVHEEAIISDSGLIDGRIISSTPAAGEVVQNGATVNVKVANGKVTAPDWRGKTKEIVVAEAKDKSITVNFVQEESDGPANMVLSQSASGLVNMSDTITVKISSARSVKEVTIPAVIGKKPLDAQVSLATAGFTRINVVNVEKAEAKEEKVVAVNPAEGSAVKTDTVIIITIEVPKK